MLRTRVIPCLLLKGQGLVKTQKFKDPKYVGDPINAIKIFNEKEVDELVLLDIAASVEEREPNFKIIEEVASECFMPLGYGGGIRSLEQIKTIFSLGVEKVIINTSAHDSPDLVRAASDTFGSQSIVVSIDVKKNFFGKYEVHTLSGSRNTKQDPVQYALEMEQRGAGELILNSVDRDGMMAGYDLQLVCRVAGAVGVPVIACGGAGNVAHLAEAAARGASALAAGSMFVFQGKHRAVLISYPERKELERYLQ
ncbi:AglZ/HisF2 family acetamidino modification protein [Geobacter sp. DSM 9736]|uniref:AglZ/HisF2 family acetamidino modification protein n=1 Tax=Geobacter sp. DSM 9736 TaxID=1277350 RepID=UPI000B50F99C|nr:AglZ/HisF2 family acetamidino modification protein [Geobacter sp. DSM 9736]SNB45056.1 cyclase [Geobacter sp. DSM 9736]